MHLSQAGEGQARGDIEQNGVGLTGFRYGPGAKDTGEFTRLAAANDLKSMILQYVFEANQ